MATDYDALYQAQRHALGGPSQIFTTFFASLDKPLRVLDVGCGQGRDALFIARLGHQVTGVDISEAGIAQLEQDAATETLPIRTIAADITTYDFDAVYDIVLVDRTLHMLDERARLEVLDRLLAVVSGEGYLLLADEPRNISAMLARVQAQEATWRVIKQHKGFLFAQRMSY